MCTPILLLSAHAYMHKCLAIVIRPQCIHQCSMKAILIWQSLMNIHLADIHIGMFVGIDRYVGAIHSSLCIGKMRHF